MWRRSLQNQCKIQSLNLAFPKNLWNAWAADQHNPDTINPPSSSDKFTFSKITGFWLWHHDAGSASPLPQLQKASLSPCSASAAVSGRLYYLCLSFLRRLCPLVAVGGDVSDGTLSRTAGSKPLLLVNKWLGIYQTLREGPGSLWCALWELAPSPP